MGTAACVWVVVRVNALVEGGRCYEEVICKSDQDAGRKLWCEDGAVVEGKPTCASGCTVHGGDGSVVVSMYYIAGMRW